MASSSQNFLFLDFGCGSPKRGAECALYSTLAKAIQAPSVCSSYSHRQYALERAKEGALGARPTSHHLLGYTSVLVLRQERMVTHFLDQPQSSDRKDGDIISIAVLAAVERKCYILPTRQELVCPEYLSGSVWKCREAGA